MYANEVDIENLMKDLRRTCCSSEYMFFYSIQLLKSIEIAIYNVEDDGNINHFELNKVENRYHTLGAKRKFMETDSNHHESNEIQNNNIHVMKRKDTYYIIMGKLRRVRQELEIYQIWNREVDHNWGGLGGAELQALRLTDLFTSNSQGHTARVTVYELLRHGALDPSLIQTLINEYLK